MHTQERWRCLQWRSRVCSLPSGGDMHRAGHVLVQWGGGMRVGSRPVSGYRVFLWDRRYNLPLLILHQRRLPVTP